MPKGATGKIRKGMNMSSPTKYATDGGKGSHLKDTVKELPKKSKQMLRIYVVSVDKQYSHFKAWFDINPGVVSESYTSAEEAVGHLVMHQVKQTNIIPPAEIIAVLQVLP